MSAIVRASTPGAPWLACTSRRSPENVPAEDPVIKSVGPSIRPPLAPGTASVAGPESCQGRCWAFRPCTDSSLVVQARTKQGRFASGRVVLSTTLDRYYHPLRRPPDSMRLPVRRLYAPTAPGPQALGRGGPLQFPPPPSARSTSITPGGSSALRLQALHAVHDPRPVTPGSAPPCPLTGLGSRRCRLRFMLRTARLLPPTRHLTLGSDAGRFPPTPPACYRAPWNYPDGTFTRWR